MKITFEGTKEELMQLLGVSTCKNIALSVASPIMEDISENEQFILDETLVSAYENCETPMLNAMPVSNINRSEEFRNIIRDEPGKTIGEYIEHLSERFPEFSKEKWSNSCYTMSSITMRDRHGIVKKNGKLFSVNRQEALFDINNG